MPNQSRRVLNDSRPDLGPINANHLFMGLAFAYSIKAKKENKPISAETAYLANKNRKHLPFRQFNKLRNLP
ncbi:hypothetical protein N5C93_07890 [Pseudomonas nitroreducens]|uniref:hypothetical protein n=1 Tax=Pseudomonas TaxID=286 RepID=UPI00114662B6|nr:MULTISPECIES: hypothetical protein [Pseudomonas]MDG9853911.1 hypothetical protein [Pseudomonas nitroreducens]MDH1072754.1 hypothetical protein [Pseudomonas nitroreducens]NMZ72364.1 hypothetical protein [Pseudomonas nitroreducens]